MNSASSGNINQTSLSQLLKRCMLDFIKLHYITLHYIIKLFIVAKVKNCKVHYGASHTTMYDRQNKCVFSFRRNDNNDVAEVTFVS